MIFVRKLLEDIQMLHLQSINVSKEKGIVFFNGKIRSVGSKYM